jgi:hypothetical protein
MFLVKTLFLTLDILNLVFAGIFTFEAMLKLIAYGKYYFDDGWNNFDFFIVCGTFGGIALSTFTSVSVGPSTTVIRAFRIGRVFRLVKRAKSLKLIFTTFIVTIPSLANIGGLLIMLIYLYSILGVFMFAPLKLQGSINVHANFQSFEVAFLTLVRISTGESWNTLMHDSVRENSILFECISDP